MVSVPMRTKGYPSRVRLTTGSAPVPALAPAAAALPTALAQLATDAPCVSAYSSSMRNHILGVRMGAEATGLVSAMGAPNFVFM